MLVAAKYAFISALMFQNPVIEQNSVEFRDMHQSMATLAYDAGRTGYVFGPFASDIFDCLERARDIGVEVGEIRDYGIEVVQRSSTISYRYNRLNILPELEGDYQYAESFQCVRFVYNQGLIIYRNQ